MPNLSGRALAEALGVTEGAVRTAAKAGRISKEKDGRYNLERCRSEWARTTDPVRTKVRKTATQSARSAAVDTGPAAGLGYLAPMMSYPDPTDRGVAMMALYVVHSIGAVTALATIDAGAPLKVAFRVEEVMAVHAMEIVEEFMARFGLPTEQMRYEPAALARIDWRKAAQAAGEPYDPAAWKAWAAQR